MAEMPQVDWAQVVEQIRRGDPAGEETLYRALNEGARLFLQRRLGTPDVQDYVHDVFLTVVQAIRLMGFVRTVLYRQLNLAISRIVGARETASVSDSASQLSNSEPDPEQLVLDRERAETMKRGMKRMKRVDVEILTRFYLRGQRPERICDEMALTATQFALRKSRAKALLASLIQLDAKRS
jgi:DNA-directed RNA polymerase specialized sigma24 family protein